MDHFCIALFFIRNELTALGRVVSFEACCQRALLTVPITRLVTQTQTVTDSNIATDTDTNRHMATDTDSHRQQHSHRHRQPQTQTVTDSNKDTDSNIGTDCLLTAPLVPPQSSLEAGGSKKTCSHPPGP